jgi:hypothetical protein
LARSGRSSGSRPGAAPSVKRSPSTTPATSSSPGATTTVRASTQPLVFQDEDVALGVPWSGALPSAIDIGALDDGEWTLRVIVSDGGNPAVYASEVFTKAGQTTLLLGGPEPVVYYATVEDDAGEARGTIRCVDDAGALSCDTVPGTDELLVYDGLYCPGDATP